jgi:hypothetical protein
MSTLDQTHDRDPFALGGRTAGEPAGDEKIFALIAEFRRVDKEYGRAHAKAESLEGQEGGDTAFAAADELMARTDGIIEELTATFPTTLAGADAVRDLAETCQREEVSDHVIDCYQHLATATSGGDAEELVLCLFRQWIAVQQERNNALEDERLSRRREDIEAEIMEVTGGGSIALAIKTFLFVFFDHGEWGIWAPLPYLRAAPDDRDTLEVVWAMSLLRDAGSLLPEIAEFAASLIHVDAELIDADMEVSWAREVLADSDPENLNEFQRNNHTELRRNTETKLASALAKISGIEAKTERGEAIKARHASDGGVLSAPDPVPTLVAERMKIWHSNDGDASNLAISDDEREKRTKRVCAQVNVLDNRIADMTSPSIAGILAQVELLMELTEDEGSDRIWGDNRDRRLKASIKAGLRNLLPADAGGAA